jgi:ribosomal protein L40E
MLDWYYDADGAIANMDGIDNPMFTVGALLDGSGYVAVERFPSGLLVLQPVESIAAGVAWCEVAAQQIGEPNVPNWVCRNCDAENPPINTNCYHCNGTARW